MQRSKDQSFLAFNIMTETWQRHDTPNLVEKVRHSQPSYDWHGEVHPTTIFDSCRKACREIEKDSEQTHHRISNFLNYSTIRGPGVSTRANTDCSCTFCELGGLHMSEAKKHNQAIINPISRLAVETDATLNLIISIKICQYCKAEIRQGVELSTTATWQRGGWTWWSSWGLPARQPWRL